MSKKNYFKVNRRLLDHPLWKSEPFTKGQAWVDLIGNANYADSYFYKKTIRIDVKRGQSASSIETLKERWGWSRGKASRFLNLLETEGMIVQQRGNQTTLITICNYEVYQSSQADDDKADDKAGSKADGGATVRQTDGQQVTSKKTKEEIRRTKKVKKVKKQYLEDSDEFRVANFLYQNILKNKPDFPEPIMRNWAETADYILRIDKRNIDTVKRVIKWATHDDFEKSNVLCMAKVRKRFDSLEMRMNEGSNNKPSYQKEGRSLMDIANDESIVI